MRAGIRAIGIDDGPFDRDHRGDVLAVGAVYRGGDRLEGILSTKVRRDGRNATDRLVRMIAQSRFHPQLHYILLDGIALAGFNVVDIQRLWRETGLPVVVVSRNRPHPGAMKQALLQHIPGSAHRWRLVRRAGAVSEIEGLFCQLAGLSAEDATQLIRITRRHGKLPEPIRTAHLVAAGIVLGSSRGRA